MNLTRLFLAILLLLLLVGQSSAALREVVDCSVSQNETLVYTPAQNHVVDLFDPDLGTLVQVDVNLSMDSTYFIKYQNQNNAPKNVMITLDYGLGITMPSGSVLGVDFYNVSTHSVLALTNPEYTFKPPDGFNFTGQNFTNVSISYTDCANLSAFTATFNGETKTFPIATFNFVVSNDTSARIEDYVVYALSEMCVKYTYDDEKLKITKTGNTSGPAKFGEEIKYEIEVCNPTTITVYNVNVYDSLLSGSPFFLGTLAPTDCRNVTASLNYTVTEDDVCRGWINNTANATGEDVCGSVIETDKNATWNVSTSYNASMNITKTANTSGPVSYGDIITYTINVTNTGDVDLTGVKVVDDLLRPSGWPMIKLVPGESYNYIIQYQVKLQDVTRGFIVNNATANGTDPCSGAVGPVEANVTLDVNKFCISGKKVINCFQADLSGWNITLYDASGTTLLNWTLTNTTGYYEFCGLDPGDYIVCETARPDYTNVTDSCVKVGLHDNETGIDFENDPLLCISGHKIIHCVQADLSGWNITLYDAGGRLLDWNLTDATGYYEFCGLKRGSYRVCEEVKNGYTNVSDTCKNVTLNGCVNVTGIDFENDPLLCISGHKIIVNCPNADRSGWNITLYDAGGKLLDWNLTDATGYYKFCGLKRGDYRVCEEVKNGYTNVSDTCRDVPLNGCVNVTGIDFENEPLLCISGHKIINHAGADLSDWNITLYDAGGKLLDWNLTNATGYYSFCGLVPGSYRVCETARLGYINVTDACEDVTLICNNAIVDFENQPHLTCIGGYKLDTFGKGLEGWTIFVDYNNSGTLDPGEPYNVTDANGRWRICDLVVGSNVNLTEVLKAGWKPVDPAGGCQQVTVRANDTDDYNFTNEPYDLCISGYKINNCTGGTIPGWTVSLYNETGDWIKNATTDADGWYAFTGLSPGNYTVCEDLPAGWTNVSERCIDVPLGVINVSDQNFTNDPPGCIFGRKLDFTNNKGLEGWTMVLKNATGGKLDEKKTDADGRYWFCGLVPGDYTVCEVPQSGWTNVTPICQNVTLLPCGGAALDFINDPRNNLTITKEADKYEVQECELVNYTIRVCNGGGASVGNVTVWDIFNRYVEILSMSPAPGPDDKWHFASIPAGECAVITIRIKVPERQDFEFGMEQGVSGEGFVNVANDYSTTFEEYLIKNCAYATSDWNVDPISSCICVTVGADMGTELETREYGSGRYDSEEKVDVYTENKSIEWEEDVSAGYNPTTLTLYNNRTVSYDSAWVKKARAKNYVTGASMSETYHDAAWLDRESRIFLDENESVMAVESEFDGRGHIGFLKLPTNTSPRQTTPLFEATEDYTGSFKVVEKIDEYGSAVTSEKAASGSGLVVVDKRVGESQRSYESGAGSYDSEELIETYTSYIAKDISVVNSPMNQSLTGDVSINSSMKWKEGIYSKVPETSFIGEEYTSITELDKETVARGLNEMDTLANFSGQARYRAILKDEVDIDEAYSGDYSVERRVMFIGTAKYDRPHLNVTKTLDGIVEETEPWGYNETHLPGEVKKRTVATYTISIENDGNTALGPIYVRDLFPPGAVFDEPSSLRPTELTETSTNWTLTHLAIGDVATITLRLDVTKYYPEELTNRVEVCGGYGDGWVCASNFSSIELNWLSCCLDDPVSVTKTAEVDDADPDVVWYRIDIMNRDNVTRAATVTDHLPEGMVLLDSMVPFASYNGSTITWNLIDIGPFETVTIPYRVSAQHPGRFVNSVLVDARSVDGPVVQPIRASSTVEVGEPSECESTACGLWSPPNWEFEYVGSYSGDLTCADLS